MCQDAKCCLPQTIYIARSLTHTTNRLTHAYHKLTHTYMQECFDQALACDVKISRATSPVPKYGMLFTDIIHIARSLTHTTNTLTHCHTHAYMCARVCLPRANIR